MADPASRSSGDDPATPSGAGALAAERAVEAIRALARAARMLERASGELSLAQYRVLSAVAAGEDRAARVAQRLELGRPAVSAAVEGLCRNGLLERFEVVGDQRAFALEVTAGGRVVLRQAEERMTAVLAELCAKSGDEEQALEVLAALGVAIDQLQAERLERRREGRQ